MAALHLVNRSRALADCLQIAAPDDTILLIEDAVFRATAALAPPGRALLALQPDVSARGLTGRLAATVTCIDDADFVQRVVDHQPIVTWR